MECGVFRMGEPGSDNITVYLVFRSKWIETSSLETSKFYYYAEENGGHKVAYTEIWLVY